MALALLRPSPLPSPLRPSLWCVSRRVSRASQPLANFPQTVTPGASSADVEGASATSEAPLTTSTVYTTLVQTTTSAGTEHVVTKTVALYTTVCPVTATATPTGHSVAPLQSSYSAYYPTPSQEVDAAAVSSTPCASTGFITVSKAGVAAPSGYRFPAKKY